MTYVYLPPFLSSLPLLPLSLSFTPSLPPPSLSQQLYSEGQSEFLQIQFTKANDGIKNLVCTCNMYIVCLVTP